MHQRKNISKPKYKHKSDFGAALLKPCVAHKLCSDCTGINSVILTQTSLNKDTLNAKGAYSLTLSHYEYNCQ